MRRACALFFSLFGFTTATLAEGPAAASPEPLASKSVALHAGLLQPIVLGGANVEVALRYGPVVIAYSHGWALKPPSSGAAADQRLRLVLPFSTGFGLGLQHVFANGHLVLDARAEFKLHRFEVSVLNANEDTSRRVGAYNTLTIGGGLYLNYLPFATTRSAARGLALGVNVRVWPKVTSTLDGDALDYSNETTGRREMHHAAQIGLANTPVIVNFSIGYLFEM